MIIWCNRLWAGCPGVDGNRQLGILPFWDIGHLISSVRILTQICQIAICKFTTRLCGKQTLVSAQMVEHKSAEKTRITFLGSSDCGWVFWERASNCLSCVFVVNAAPWNMEPSIRPGSRGQVVHLQAPGPCLPGSSWIIWSGSYFKKPEPLPIFWHIPKRGMQSIWVSFLKYQSSKGLWQPYGGENHRKMSGNICGELIINSGRIKCLIITFAYAVIARHRGT